MDFLRGEGERRRISRRGREGGEGDSDGAAVILGEGTRSRVRRGGEGEGWSSDWKWVVRRERREVELIRIRDLDRREGGVESIGVFVEIF